MKAKYPLRAKNSTGGDWDAKSLNVPKVYRAIITQSSTSAPTATVFENSLGKVITWTRSAAGQYVGTATGAFTAGKTFILVGSRDQNGIEAEIVKLIWSVLGGADTVSLKTATYTWNGVAVAGVYADDVLDSTAIEIRVYP